jgi:hypothetical protein
MTMTTSEHRWLVVETTGRLWLLERAGAAMSGRIVTRADLAAGHPRLLRALQAGDHKDTPRVVPEPPG